MEQFLKNEFKKRKDTLIEKRGPLDRAVDTSIKKPLFVLEISLTPTTTYNLKFFEDDSIDYAYRRFLYALNNIQNAVKEVNESIKSIAEGDGE